MSLPDQGARPETASPDASQPPEAEFLRMEHISKSFPGVRALDDVSFDARSGEVHALLGENGAGKSTLMKILTGALHKDSGAIYLNGKEVNIQSPGNALALGITIIHQELATIPYLDVGQNIYLGREPSLPLGRIDWRKLYQDTRADLQMVGEDLDPRTPVGELSIAQQQMVEIAKALSQNARLIAMDEPTSSLSEHETEVLFDLIRSLKQQGVTIIYISHRLEEIFEIADRVTVLRDGHFIATHPIGEVSPEGLVREMVGRDVQDLFAKETAPRQEKVLSVRGLSSAHFLRDIGFDLYRGEILGLAGLVGSGRSTLARTLFGAEKIESGEISVDGRSIHLTNPRDAIHAGMGMVPEDRKTESLFLNMAVSENIVISALPELSRSGVINFARVRKVAQDFVNKLRIRTPSLSQRTRNLSGGNQQKLAISRWLTLNPKVLILDEPTRGIDVGAKSEIHALMSQLAAQGMGILMISSELPEVLGVSDRILVMSEGRIVAEFPREKATQEAIISAASLGMNGNQEEPK